MHVNSVAAPRPRLVTAVLGCLLLVITALAVAISPAHAKDPWLCQVTDDEGNVSYVVCSDGDDAQDAYDDAIGDSSGPTCELTEGYSTYCKSDDVACLLNDPSLNPQDVVAEDAGPKPGGDEEYHIAYESCSDGSGRDWFWTTGETLTREELATQAFGALNFPTFTPTFNPPATTYVNFDTWWWAQGAGTQDLVGSSAGAVRAVATPDHMEIDPGDGTGVVTCDFVTAKSDECAHSYRRSSDRLPGRAYSGRMRLVWDVSFEEGGTPFAVPGLDSFASPWQDVAVPVREIQTIVVPGR